MTPVLDAFWRAVGYCLYPRVMLLSFLPLLITAGGVSLLGYFFWESALARVQLALQSWSLGALLLHALDTVGGAGFRSVLAPLVVVALSVPVIVVVALLLVALLATPALANMVAARRFAALERRYGAALWQGIAASFGCATVALLALAASVPLWLLPPMLLLIPPLIWGWLTYRVLSFEVLAEHASQQERLEITRRHRGPLLAMGLVAGYLAAAPSLIWTLSAMTLILAPLLMVVAVWLYTMVFAFSSLWFAHYALAALAALRASIPSVADPTLQLQSDGSPPAAVPR